MATASATVTPLDDSERSSWLPMIVIAMGQALMSFNVAAIPVSMAGMVRDFDTAPTTVGTAVVMYSLGVSGFVMLGAKLGQRFGPKRVFQTVVAIFALAMLLMVISPTSIVMLAAQGIAGLAAAALVPSLVALIAHHYRGKQQAEAVGWLGSARAIAGVLAFVIVGFIAAINWRLAFALLIVHAVAILVLSFKLKPSDAKPEVQIDGVGVVLAALGIGFFTFGVNNLRSWGLLLSSESAPFDLLGVSPAPLMMVVGVVFVTGFFLWSHRRAATGKTPLLALEVVDSAKEWAAVVALFVIVSMEAAINFSVPLYIQIVQGRSPMQTSIAMMPFMLTVFFTAILIVRLYGRLSPRQLARYAFCLVFGGALWLAFTVSNDWSTIPVIIGLVTVGLGQGALVTLLFNVLVTSSPKELAGDVGSLRGVTQNLAAAVGTAVIGTLLVGVLSSVILSNIAATPKLSEELLSQVNLDSITFVSNAQLETTLAATTADPAEVAEAIRINSESRLQALRTGFLVMAALALLALLPCGWLPNYRPNEIPDDSPASPAKR
jgi:MFS family permease